MGPPGGGQGVVSYHGPLPTDFLGHFKGVLKAEGIDTLRETAGWAPFSFPPSIATT